MVTALPALRTDLVSFDELVLEVFPFPPSDVDRDVERVWTDTRADERSVIVIRQYRNTAQVRAIFIFWLLVLLLSTFYVDVFPAAMCFRKITCFRLECGLIISQPHLHPVPSSAFEVFNRLNNAFAITYLCFSRLFCQHARDNACEQLESDTVELSIGANRPRTWTIRIHLSSTETFDRLSGVTVGESNEPLAVTVRDPMVDLASTTPLVAGAHPPAGAGAIVEVTIVHSDGDHAPPVVRFSFTHQNS